MQIDSGLLDLALGYQYKAVSGVVFEPLFTERLILVTSFADAEDWRKNYIPIAWDAKFEEDQRRFIGELQDSYRIRAHFIDVARTILSREPASAYVIERSVRPLLKEKRIKRVKEAPVFERPAHVIYPSRPTHPDVQALALEGFRELAKTLE